MSEPRTIAVATNNVHKIAEMSQALQIEGLRFVSIGELIPGWESPVEDADTFEGNALIKARAVCQATGLAALADDSGLEVDALAGMPGVHSSSYGGVEGDDSRNNARLLAELAGVPWQRRGARFVSTLVVVGLDGHDGQEHGGDTCSQYMKAVGAVKGTIGVEPRGAHGFGYDPLFLPDETPGKTMAELTLEEKNAISHRGRALRELKRMIEAKQ